MEKISTVELVLMLSLVLGLLVGQSSAACSDDCFGSCLPGGSGRDRSGCINHCIRQCLSPPPPRNSASFETITVTDAQSFCKLGCVSSCVNLSTEKKPGEMKVKSCVESCSKTCTRI